MLFVHLSILKSTIKHILSKFLLLIKVSILLTYSVSLKIGLLFHPFPTISKMRSHLLYVINIITPLETLYFIVINLFKTLIFAQILLIHEIVLTPSLSILMLAMLLQGIVNLFQIQEFVK